MLIQILSGFLISMVCVMIHAMATIAAISVARIVGVRDTTWPRCHLMAVMIAVMVVLKAAHGLEVAVWALAYSALGGPAFHLGEAREDRPVRRRQGLWLAFLGYIQEPQPQVVRHEGLR